MNPINKRLLFLYAKYDIQINLSFCYLFGILLSYDQLAIASDKYGEIWCNMWGIPIQLICLPGRLIAIQFGNMQLLQCYKTLFFMTNVLFIYFGLFSILKLLKQNNYSYKCTLFLLTFILLSSAKTSLYQQMTDYVVLTGVVWSVYIIMYYYISNERISFKSFLCYMILISLIVGLRKNSVLLFPLLIFPIIYSFHFFRRLSLLSNILITLIISFIAYLPFHTKPLETVMGLEDLHQERVFMASDILCMRMIQGKENVIEYEELTYNEKQAGWFGQRYGVHGDHEKIRNDWVNEIKESPSSFFFCRVINYAQLLTGDVLPKSFAKNLEKKYGIRVRTIYDHDGNIFIRLAIAIVPLLLFISSCIILTMTIINFLKGKTCLSRNMNCYFYMVILTALLSIVHLLSFLPFVPTPDFRYKYISIIMSTLTIGFWIDSLIYMRRKRQSTIHNI